MRVGQLYGCLASVQNIIHKSYSKTKNVSQHYLQCVTAACAQVISSECLQFVSEQITSMQEQHVYTPDTLKAIKTILQTAVIINKQTTKLFKSKCMSNYIANQTLKRRKCQACNHLHNDTI